MNGHRHFEAVVIGGGLVGSSIAYHLARARVPTLLIEQGDLASGASGANFGNVQVEDSEYGLSLELTLRSFARFKELAAELEYDVGLRRSGQLLLIENPQQMALMQERAVRLQAVGLKAEVLHQADLRHLEPHLNLNAARRALPSRRGDSRSFQARACLCAAWARARPGSLDPYTRYGHRH